MTIRDTYTLKQTLYCIRWQLSTPILAIVPILMKAAGLLHFGSSLNFWVAAFISNLIGSFIFYWVDRWIFKKRKNI